ncbi:MAG: response regulator, partial [Candidatus Marinimicrobia bacterium]|nr:response regulator [Candidatus Neomarinimicrobiota bacterium]
IAARKKALEIISNYNCRSVQLYSDIIRLQQVLGNILDNAVKFTHEGTITVTTRVSNNLYNIEIQDTGIGINKEFKPYLFDLFKQAEEGFNRSYEGAGLGLAISYRLISAMKGHIEVESREGHGSTFTITLPIPKLDANKSKTSLKKRKNQVEEKSYTMSNDVKPGKKLLVLEDNPANTKYIEFLLKKLGHDYISIDSGTKALAEIESIQPDGMLIDISLSEEMDGIEFLKQVRNIAGFEDTPAIAVTAHAMKGMHEDFLKHGFNDYLSKPFTVKGLAEIIERNL